MTSKTLNKLTGRSNKFSNFNNKEKLVIYRMLRMTRVTRNVYNLSDEKLTYHKFQNLIHTLRVQI